MAEIMFGLLQIIFSERFSLFLCSSQVHSCLPSDNEFPKAKHFQIFDPFSFRPNNEPHFGQQNMSEKRSSSLKSVNKLWKHVRRPGRCFTLELSGAKPITNKNFRKRLPSKLIWAPYVNIWQTFICVMKMAKAFNWRRQLHPEIEYVD